MNCLRKRRGIEMWQCPLCGKEHGEETLCSCGWSRTRDYLNYNTLCAIGDREKEKLSEQFSGSKYALTRETERQNSGDWMSIPGDSEPPFR